MDSWYRRLCPARVSRPPIQIFGPNLKQDSKRKSFWGADGRPARSCLYFSIRRGGILRFPSYRYSQFEPPDSRLLQRTSTLVAFSHTHTHTNRSPCQIQGISAKTKSPTSRRRSPCSISMAMVSGSKSNEKKKEARGGFLGHLTPVGNSSWMERSTRTCRTTRGRASAEETGKRNIDKNRSLWMQEFHPPQQQCQPWAVDWISWRRLAPRMCVSRQTSAMKVFLCLNLLSSSTFRVS